MQAPEVLGGRYELRGVLGRGGMAEVRDGWDIRLDRPVAVKLLHPILIEAPDNLLRFQTEARAAAALSHPHIVSVHDSGEHAGTPYIVMERLSGQTLADVIAHGPLPQPQVRAILDDVLSALAAAHAAGILHRDIKPANILFSVSGHVKVADFGVAKSPGSVHTMTGQIVGTMAYLSPDRIAGRPASVADDLYAVGVVGYEALTGRRAFPQQNIGELARAILEGALAPVTALLPDADPALAAAIGRAMALDPAWRFSNAEEMRAALAGRVGPPARPTTRVMAAPLPDPTTMVAAAPTPRHHRSRWWLLTAAVVAVLVIAIAFIVDSSSRPAVPEPASTSTTVPPPPTTSFVPPPTTTPVQVEQPPPPKGPPGHGNGKGPKKHRD
ncbi:serine/threonine-protein kinase [Mycobacterium sp. NPDC048908]|uniref:serine/threonine-protein kinase n=1 Tax=Mycobacterium sp. NPDC048908 TaxID=3364292 RepID=UPI00371BF457